MDVVDLCYIFEEDRFTDIVYDRLKEKARRNLRWTKLDQKVRKELEKNFESGEVRGDYLRSEAECRARIAASPQGAGRNYWITMLHLIRAERATK